MKTIIGNKQITSGVTTSFGSVDMKKAGSGYLLTIKIKDLDRMRQQLKVGGDLDMAIDSLKADGN